MRIRIMHLFGLVLALLMAESVRAVAHSQKAPQGSGS